MNSCTLFGSVIGQLLFGFLSDLFGRTRLYGIELVIVVISTLGLAFSSPGYQSMSFLGLFTFWRFVTGVGLGAECEALSFEPPRDRRLTVAPDRSVRLP